MTAKIMDAAAGKYLTFVLGDEEYGVGALKVQGILTMQRITPIPRAPHYLKGVATVRGQVVPVVSARARLGMMEVEDTSETCIILVTLGAGPSCAGLIVDTVRDVVDIREDEVEPPPPVSDYNNDVVALAKSGDRVRILLDVGVILGDVAAYAAAES